MKKTSRIELGNNIRHTFISFFAIVLFVACASALFVGIHWTISSVSLCTEKEYEDGRMYHFKIQSSVGFPDDVIDEVKQSEYVNELETFHETYRFFTFHDEPCQAKVLSLTERINAPLRVDGRLPEKNGEAAIDSHFAKSRGVRVGDTLKLTSNEFLNPEGLLTDEVKITGIIDTAEYMEKHEDTNGFSFASYACVNAVLYLPKESFNRDVFGLSYGFYIRSDALGGVETLSDAYAEKSADIKADITDRLSTAAARSLHAEKEAVSGQYVLTERNHNASLFGLKCIRDTFVKMQYSLVALFLLISLLVCYSTLSRNVHDQSVLIGMKKAQGFSTGGIMMPFVMYSELAAVIGIVLGLPLGYFAIEPITVHAINQIFLFGEFVPYSNVVDVVVLAALIMALVLVTVMVACYRVSAKKALTLLTGETPKTGRSYDRLDRWPITRRFSTFTKSAVRGCFENKRRVIATVIGVIGSTALVVSALTMYLNLDRSLKINFRDVTNYDKTVLFEQSDSAEKIETALKQKGYRYTQALYTFGLTKAQSGENVVTTVYVADDADFYDFLHLRSVGDGAEGRAKDGIWVNVGYAENNDAKKGDTLSFTDALGGSHEFEIEGIYDYYLINHQIVMSKSTFEQNFGGRKYAPNIFLVNTDGVDFDTFKNDLSGIEGITSVQDYFGAQQDLFDGFLIIARAVVAVYLLLSVLLAVFILLNLYTMFVREKKNEIIILMINGYSRKSVERYFYIDTFVLTLIGLLVGIAVGVLTGGMSLDSFNNEATHFMNEINLFACAVGAVFSFVLSALMCKIALRKVKKFECSDISAD